VTNSRPCGSAILVVDDDEGLRACIGAVLRAAGFGVELAADGHEALAAAREHVVQAVVLDICLPGLSGYEVCKRMRQMPATQNVLLVALTGYGQKEDQLRTSEAGFDRHFVKPTDPHRLVEVIDEWSQSQAVAATTASKRTLRAGVE
jgi:CheY-like chemotaxis protein